MRIDLFERKTTRFVLWRPRFDAPPPVLFIGQIEPRDDRALATFREIPLIRSADAADLWEIAASACGLEDGRLCFYWFKVARGRPDDDGTRLVYVTDPFAWAVDRRFPAPAPPGGAGEATGDPVSVILHDGGRLVHADPGLTVPDWSGDAPIASLPPNERLVLYELPTRWTLAGAATDGPIAGVGTFRDALALVSAETGCGSSFAGANALGPGNAHLIELGINALELLPPADSDDVLSWGYGTSNCFAADFDLGRPAGQDHPTSSSDLTRLIRECHRHGIRFFLDVVMAFSRGSPWADVNFLDFLVRWRPPGAPDRDPEQGRRDGFGGDLFKFNHVTEAYDPILGRAGTLVPARAFLEAHIAHWMQAYRVDGLRLDSVNNIDNWDFLWEIRELARWLWSARGGRDGGFLVVAEDLAVPVDLVRQGRVEALWNERFKWIARSVLLGRAADGDATIEDSVRTMVDCRRLGFRRGTEAVNYLGSHDVGGHGNERIHDFLEHRGVVDTERRIKLGFACLLTAVGIPMIFAGDEFADRHDLPVADEHADRKQVDPVNWGRLAEPWRRRVFDHVARLVRLRTSHEALATDEVAFIHADVTGQRRVLAWTRGLAPDLVVVVANFSDWGTPDPTSPDAEYAVPGFPALPPGRRWREITQDRDVPHAWAGREPLYPWEAKVYATVT